jgi:hypothetical protein
MGMGDELMALGQARAHGGKVQILDRHGQRRWHPLWEGASYVARPGEPGEFPAIVNGGRVRPYIDWPASTPARWAFTDWRVPMPGQLFHVKPDPRADGLILLEPNLKPGASVNKQWGRWQDLVNAAPGMPWGQPGNPGTRFLKGVVPLVTRNFQDACNLLAACRTAVLPEGGLHHAAAALGKSCVVLYGCVISPRNTGYDLHRNIFIDEPRGSGWRIHSPICATVWKQITPATVLTELERVLLIAD